MILGSAPLSINSWMTSTAIISSSSTLFSRNLSTAMCSKEDGAL
ncbi:Uncharacterized protein APZ42_024135 [Daphnia magna]|uniref:Uncharacterized protein n=1 Tax=Daphnia magna TaxID=35525 RepID=A0A164UGY2_9CRUS|nr:Uncharacterized protein APZ42_024135 [Daphnia magna]